LRFSLGVISLMELEQAELARNEAALKYQQALHRLHLARQAYLLARQGITV